MKMKVAGMCTLLGHRLYRFSQIHPVGRVYILGGRLPYNNWRCPDGTVAYFNHQAVRIA